VFGIIKIVKQKNYREILILPEITERQKFYGRHW